MAVVHQWHQPECTSNIRNGNRCSCLDLAGATAFHSSRRCCGVRYLGNGACKLWHVSTSFAVLVCSAIRTAEHPNGYSEEKSGKDRAYLFRSADAGVTFSCGITLASLGIADIVFDQLKVKVIAHEVDIGATLAGQPQSQGGCMRLARRSGDRSAQSSEEASTTSAVPPQRKQHSSEGPPPAPYSTRRSGWILHTCLGAVDTASNPFIFAKPGRSLAIARTKSVTFSSYF